MQKMEIKLSDIFLIIFISAAVIGVMIYAHNSYTNYVNNELAKIDDENSRYRLIEARLYYLEHEVNMLSLKRDLSNIDEVNKRTQEIRKNRFYKK
jgi:hypothetical protein